MGYLFYTCGLSVVIKRICYVMLCCQPCFAPAARSLIGEISIPTVLTHCRENRVDIYRSLHFMVTVNCACISSYAVFFHYMWKKMENTYRHYKYTFFVGQYFPFFHAILYIW